MIHEIDATTGEITRTWDTGTYWINHQAYVDLDLIPYLGGEETACDFDLQGIAETVLRSPDGDHLVIAPAYEDETAHAGNPNRRGLLSPATAGARIAYQNAQNTRSRKDIFAC